MSGSATFTIPSVFTAVDRFSGTMKIMNAAVSGFANRGEVAMARVDRAFNRLMNPLNAFRRALNSVGLYFGIWFLIRAVQGAIGVMADFEQANVNISTVIERSELPLMSAMSKQARSLAVNYGVAAKGVSELQYELLKMGNSARTVVAMTEAIVTGAVAMRTTPERMAEVAGAVFKAYQLNLEGPDGGKIAKSYIDKLALAANLTAADFESYATQLPIVTAVASMGNVEYEKILAMLGATRDLQIHTATASTSVKNMILDIVVKQRKTFDQAIEAINSIETKQGTLIYAFDKYGKKTVVTAAGLKQVWGRVEEIYQQLKNPAAFSGYAESIAKKQLLSVKGHVALLKSAWQEMILSFDDGTGRFAASLKTLTQVATAMLLITSGSQAANEKLGEMSPLIVDQANKWLGFIGIIWSFIKAVAIMKAVMLAARGVMLVITAAQWLWSVAQGISTAITGGNVMALKGNIIALKTLRIVTMATTASQWGMNLAMYASPLVIFAIGALAVIGVMKLMGSWLDNLASGFDAMGMAAADSNENVRKFYMDNMMDPAFRAQNPDVVNRYMAENAPVAGFSNSEENQRRFSKIKAINPMMTMEEWRNSYKNPSLESQSMNGKIKIEIADPNGSVKNVDADFGNIKPVVSSSHAGDDGFKSWRDSR